MLLTFADRLMLLNLLPGEGNIVTLRVVGQLRDALGYSEQEIATAQIKQEGDRMTWDPAGAAECSKEVEIGEAARGLIVEALKKLNDEKKLTPAHVPLYERFVEAAGPT